MTYIQQRYVAACKIADGSEYTKGRMTGVCMVAEHTFGYKGDDMSIRLQLLSEVLATKG